MGEDLVWGYGRECSMPIVLVTALFRVKSVGDKAVELTGPSVAVAGGSVCLVCSSMGIGNRFDKSSEPGQSVKV